MAFDKVIADKLERHLLKGLVGVGGYYSCEVCKGKGKHRVSMTWPHPDFYHCPLRTHNEQKEIAR